VPEDVGWSSEKLEEAKAFAEKINSAAVMSLYDGKIFISWGNVDKNYKCHSIRKPFLSALYGIYRKRGKIDLNATDESTQAYSTVSEEMGVGYGYMWNVVKPKGPFAQLFGGHSAFYHTGVGIPYRGWHPHSCCYPGTKTCLCLPI